jgi:pimeloyl-ACP methyl ester carboxylesterase
VTRPQTLTRDLAPGAPGGPVVAFVHGLEDSWTSWLPLAGALDPTWRLHALDLPWRPGNDYRWRSRSPAHWVTQGLDGLAAPPDVVVAHSYGANAILQLLCCAFDPGLGRAVALLCPFYRLPDRPPTWRMFDRSRATFDQHVRDGVRIRMGDRAASTEPDVLESMMSKTLDRVGPSGFLAVFEQFVASGDLPLGAVGLPALVLAGGADATLSREAAVALAAGMPRASLHFQDDYDHFCHIKQARGVAEHVAKLVEADRAETDRATTWTVGDLL